MYIKRFPVISFDWSPLNWMARPISFFYLYPILLLLISLWLKYISLFLVVAHLPSTPHIFGRRPRYKLHTHVSYQNYILLHTSGRLSMYKLPFHAFDYLPTARSTHARQPMNKCQSLLFYCLPNFPHKCFHLAIHTSRIHVSFHFYTTLHTHSHQSILLSRFRFEDHLSSNLRT